ncbi:MAG: hypothetical protein KDB82_11360 [Planctomycetes bacterium]|nr:hypothetical protein [Planctomycetota bacterium]
MSDREHLELLASRHLDGDLSPREEAELQAALDGDASLRDLHLELERVHNSMNLLSESRLPSDFTNRILSGLEKAEPAGAPVLRLPTGGYKHWAAAAAILMVLGLLIASAAFNSGGKPQDASTLAFEKPSGLAGGSVGSGKTYTGPTTHVVAFSEGELEVSSGDAKQRGKQLDGDFPLPAVISAPSDTHAVVSVNGGTVVLAPGAKARLLDADADGTPDFEPIDGDLYFENSGNGMRSTVDGVNLDVDGGLTLRHTANGYLAEPSHGGALAGDQQFAFRQCALINKGGVQIQPCEDVLLDDWAIRGRVDAIREQMKRLLGDKYDRVPEQFWKHWDKFLRGVMSQPWQSATVAYSIKFLLKYDFVEQLTDAECDVFSTIADILSEGTTEKDIPVQVLEMFRSAEERFDQNPDELADFKQMMRRYFERMSELERKRHGG